MLHTSGTERVSDTAKTHTLNKGGPIFWVFFFLGVFFFFYFPWFFLGKQQFPYVLDGFGVIFLGFPTKKHVFCFSLVFPRENNSFLMFWTDLA